MDFPTADFKTPEDYHGTFKVVYEIDSDRGPDGEFTTEFEHLPKHHASPTPGDLQFAAKQAAIGPAQERASKRLFPKMVTVKDIRPASHD